METFNLVHLDFCAKIMRFLIILIGAAFLCGCESVQLPDSSVKPIVLKQSYTRPWGLSTLQLPAGVYQPDFTTADGVYYRAPGHLVESAVGMHTLMRGGLFVPFSGADDLRQGVWLDQQESSGGALAFGLSSPKRVYRFDEPIPYETQTSQP